MSLAANRSPDQIEAEIDRIRARLDATLSEVEHRLTPRELLRDGIGALSGIEATRYVVKLAGIVRRYPVPAGIAVITVAALALAGGHRRHVRLSDTAGSRPRVPQPRISSTDKLLDARQKIAEATSTARTKLSGAASSSVERAGALAGSAGRQLRRATDRAQIMARRQPVAASAIALALGAAVALSLPSVRRKLHRA
jgi:uncharacterized protein DUF3618